ncbi:RapH phosphatase inhibitor [Bacillus sp. 179-C3.3 HS]|uniref:RapH phosphatase inhibitor n=1 Tax=Bacillus sp. 179-C3.3 HS TaxID=3232162 RepID=UPI0039A03B10
MSIKKMMILSSVILVGVGVYGATQVYHPDTNRNTTMEDSNRNTTMIQKSDLNNI